MLGRHLQSPLQVAASPLWPTDSTPFQCPLCRLTLLRSDLQSRCMCFSSYVKNKLDSREMLALELCFLNLREKYYFNFKELKKIVTTLMLVSQVQLYLLLCFSTQSRTWPILGSQLIFTECMYGPQTPTSSSWVVITNEDSWAPPRPSESECLGVRTENLHFKIVFPNQIHLCLQI